MKHVYRKRELEHLSMTEEKRIKRQRRQCLLYIENLNKWATDKNITDNKFMRARDGKVKRRAIVTYVGRQCAGG